MEGPRPSSLAAPSIWYAEELRPHAKLAGSLALAISGLLLAKRGWNNESGPTYEGSGVGSTVAVTTGWVATGPTWFQRNPSLSLE